MVLNCQCPGDQASLHVCDEPACMPYGLRYFSALGGMHQHTKAAAACYISSPAVLQVEVKGRVNLDKLTAFLEELRVSRSRTVSLGTLSCAHAASAADHTHIVEVRHEYHRCTQRPRPNTDMSCDIVKRHVLLLLSGNHWLSGIDLCIARGTCQLHSSLFCLCHNICFALWCMKPYAGAVLALVMCLSMVTLQPR